MDTMERMERVCVVAVDGSKHSNYALNWFLKNLYTVGDKLLLVHCIDHRKAFSYGTVAMVPGNPDSITHAYEHEEKKAHDLMTQLQTQLSNQQIPATILKVPGEPGESIIRTADERKADMIVTGCRGLGQIRRTILGSVSDYILHHASVPVIVCRHDD